MQAFSRWTLIISLIFAVSCSTNSPRDGAEESGTSVSSGNDDFSDFDTSPQSNNPEASIEQEMNQASAPPAEEPASPPPAATEDEFAQFDQPQEAQPEPQQPVAVDPGPTDSMEAPPPEPAPEIAVEAPPPVEAPAPEPEPPAVAEAPVRSSGLVNIVGIQYRANDNGGTVVIEGDGSLNGSTRFNKDTNQFIVEIPEAKLPKKLKRPFNTRDFAGTIGSIDAYQGRKSTVARIVIQLRAGAPEPVLQAEGNHLFIVAQPPIEDTSIAATTGDEERPTEALPSKLLSSENMEEFLAGNSNFYGKKISIETDNADLKDIFRLISEESNINLMISDSVSGKITLKLKSVPWDQALIMIMKTKKLGYSRIGNVLRIAPLDEIRKDEDDTQKLIANRKLTAPLKIKTIPINYAKIEDMERQVKSVLSKERGTTVGDPRTSSLVISDFDENIARAEKLIKALDVPPQQVLIEGKVVEASDNFQRQIGINWGAPGRPYQWQGMKSSLGSLRSTTGLQVSPGSPSGGSLGLSFSLGTLDILGDLTAALSLLETQNLVKVISSPRVVTLHNEPAEINQSTELPIITSAMANGQTQQNVSFKSVKLKLSVTPQVTNDGAVIMTLDVNRDIPGPIQDQTSGARPINTRSAKTKVIVRNSQTAVIGGIYQNDTSDNENRVPWLGTIPFLGWLFKSKTITKDRNELLIFVTPRVLGQLESGTASGGQMGGEL